MHARTCGQYFLHVGGGVERELPVLDGVDVSMSGCLLLKV